MSENILAPSMLSADFKILGEQLKETEEAGAQYIHFDVMDGKYVKNVMLGTTIYKDIKRLSSLPVDVHIMAWAPEEFIPYYDVQPGDRISFHPETTAQPYKLLQSIKERGCRAGLVLNPGTPLGYLEECVHLVDYVMLMTVNPGFAGQKMVPDALEKIVRIRRLLDDYGRTETDLLTDGNTTPENAKLMKQAGANAFVVGTSSIIKGLDVFEDLYYGYKKMLEEA